MRLGVTRMLFKTRGPREEEKERVPLAVTGSMDPLPTMMLEEMEGMEDEGDDDESIPELLAM